MEDRPFRILGIQQIAIGGADKQRLRSLWVDLFGLAVKSSFTSERENVDEDICALGSDISLITRSLMSPATSMPPTSIPSRRWSTCSPRPAPTRATWKC